LEEIAGEGTLTVSQMLVDAGQLGDLAEATMAASFSISQDGPSSRRSRAVPAEASPLGKPEGRSF